MKKLPEVFGNANAEDHVLLLEISYHLQGKRYPKSIHISRYKNKLIIREQQP